MPLPIQVYRMYVAFSSFSSQALLVFTLSPFSPHPCYPSLKVFTIFLPPPPRYTEPELTCYYSSCSGFPPFSDSLLNGQQSEGESMGQESTYVFRVGLQLCCQISVFTVFLLALLLAAYHKAIIVFLFLKSGLISGKVYFFNHELPKKHFKGKLFKSGVPADGRGVWNQIFKFPSNSNHSDSIKKFAFRYIL